MTHFLSPKTRAFKTFMHTKSLFLVHVLYFIHTFYAFSVHILLNMHKKLPFFV